MNISRWIERHAAYAPAKVAASFEGRDLSYTELATEIDRLAAGLSYGLGIGRGDRVAILACNRPEFLALVFACARIGAILVPLNWRLAPPEHLYILKNAEVSALFCDAEFRGAVDGIHDEIAAIKRVGFGFSGGGWQDYASLIAADGIAADAGKLDDPVLIVYTSGTTGRPKGAVLTQNALQWNAVNSIAAHDLVSTDRVLTFLPMFHVGGLNIQTLPALHAGASVFLQARFHPGEALAAIARKRPSVTLLVPAVMKALIEHPDWAKTDMSCLRIAGAGWEVAVTREPLARYRVRATAMSRNRLGMNEAKLRVYDRLLARGRLTPAQEAAVRRRVRHLRGARAMNRVRAAWRGGRRTEALRLSLAAAPLAAAALLQDPRHWATRRRRVLAGAPGRAAAR